MVDLTQVKVFVKAVRMSRLVVNVSFPGPAAFYNAGRVPELPEEPVHGSTFHL